MEFFTKDILPETWLPVLVVTTWAAPAMSDKIGGYHIAFVDPSGKWCDYEGNDLALQFTHWATLPLSIDKSKQ